MALPVRSAVAAQSTSSSSPPSGQAQRPPPHHVEDSETGESIGSFLLGAAAAAPRGKEQQEVEHRKQRQREAEEKEIYDPSLYVERGGNRVGDDAASTIVTFRYPVAVAAACSSSTTTSSSKLVTAFFSRKDNEEWAQLRASITRIVVEDGVKALPNLFGANCHNCTEILVPDSVEEIGDKFAASSAIRSFAFSPNVKRLGAAAFIDCRQLQSVRLAGAVYPLSVRSNKGGMEIGSGPTSFSRTCYQRIGENTEQTTNTQSTLPLQFCHCCTALTSVDLSAASGLTAIDDGAFVGCQSLAELNIPSSVITIGASFLSGSGIVNFELPSSVTSIGERPLSRCPKLQSISTASSPLLTNIPNFFCSDCPSLTSVSLSNTVSSLGSSFCSKCDALETLELPNSVKEIGPYFASESSRLARFTCPPLLEELSQGFLNRAEKLKSLTLPSKLKRIGYASLTYLESLESLSLEHTKVERFDQEFLIAAVSLTEFVFPPTVRVVAQRVLSGCKSLRRVVVNSCVSSSDYTSPIRIERCDEGQEILQCIPPRFCEDCPKLESVEFLGAASTITRIESKFLTGSTSLKNLVIPPSVTHIGDDCLFQSGIAHFTCPPVLFVANDFLMKCEHLQQVTLPSRMVSPPHNEVVNFALNYCPDDDEPRRTIFFQIPETVSNAAVVSAFVSTYAKADDKASRPAWTRPVTSCWASPSTAMKTTQSQGKKKEEVDPYALRVGAVVGYHPEHTVSVEEFAKDPEGWVQKLRPFALVDSK